MSDDASAPQSSSPDLTAHESPHKGVSVERSFQLGEHTLDATVIADWLTLYDKGQPKARIFHTAYLAADADEDRPIIFCMNGGPGAGSVFLHYGCCGPVTVARTSGGKFDTAARSLESNPDSWLSFADLVFIDPVGTGFSHLIDADPAKTGNTESAASKDGTGGTAGENPYWAVKGDLDAIGQFMRRFLREHNLWKRPRYFAGESYGGYRAARLTKLLGREYGLGMAGLIVISPIWQFRDVAESDYSTSAWVNLLPTYGAIAHRNGLGRHLAPDASMDDVLASIEQFAITDYAAMLVSGDLMSEQRRAEVLAITADILGLPTKKITQARGRIPLQDFSRCIREASGEITDLYDGSVYSQDPFPHRSNNDKAIEEALFNDQHAFLNASYQWLIEELGVETPLEYTVLSHEAHKAWKNDEKQFDIFELPHSMDDFCAGMTAQEHQRALIVHGRFDTVTPYFASRRLLAQTALTPAVQSRITERLYDGGHMFYSWSAINKAFAEDVAGFVGVSAGEA